MMTEYKFPTTNFSLFSDKDVVQLISVPSSQTRAFAVGTRNRWVCDDSFSFPLFPNAILTENCLQKILSISQERQCFLFFANSEQNESRTSSRFSPALAFDLCRWGKRRKKERNKKYNRTSGVWVIGTTNFNDKIIRITKVTEWMNRTKHGNGVRVTIATKKLTCKS